MPAGGNGREVSALALVGQIGTVMVGCVMVGMLAGRGLDSWIGSRPVCMIVLMLLGAAGGMLAVYRIIVSTLGPGPPPTGGGSGKGTGSPN